MKSQTWILLGTAIVLLCVLTYALIVVTMSKRQTFPIDTVTLWVDGADAGWRDRVQEVFKSAKLAHPRCGLVHNELREPEPVGPATKDELYYGARCVAKFMPWVRTYYVLTQRPHKPWWWPASGKLGNVRMRLVHHDEIFGNHADALPVFNSNIIQAHIHNIPGLAEHFILFDDDFFVGRPLTRDNFFTPDGKRAVNSSYEMNPLTAPPGNWRQVCMNTQKLARQFLLVNSTAPVMVPDHVGYRLLKSAHKHVMENVFKDQVAALHSFRSSTDFVPHYLTNVFMVGAGLTSPLPKSYKSVFVGVLFKKRMDKWGVPHEFCINDRMQPEDVKYLEDLIQ